jgi:hypothetical protein
MDIAFLQKNYLFVPLAILLSVILTFVLNLIFPQPEEKKSYMKTVVISLVISVLAVYIHALSPITESIIMDPVPF